MATYVKDKSGAFKKHGDQSGLPTNRRSEGRMKSYTSATDARAWVNNVTENKQYIVELIGTDVSRSQQLGKYVPVDVLLKTLMKNKDEDIKKLHHVISQLESFINSLNLSCEELQSYHKLRATWGAGDAFAKKHQPRSKNSSLPLTESKYGRTASEEVRGCKTSTIQESSRTSSESRIQTPRTRTPSMPSSMSEANSNKSASRSQQYHLKHSRPSSSQEKRSVSFCTVLQPESMQNQSISKAVTALEVNISNERSFVVSLNQESSHKDVQVGYTLNFQDSHTQTVFKAKETVDIAVQYITEGLVLKSRGSSCALKSRIPVAGPTGDVKLKLTQLPTVQGHDAQTLIGSDDDTKSGCPECEKHLQATRANINELNIIKKILDERNCELQKSELRYKKLQNDLWDKEAIDDDIAEMAAQIAKLREDSSTDELKLVGTELQLLKKYCQKLIYIKDDNKKLKQELENYRSRQLSTRSVDALHKLQAHHQTLISIGSNVPRRIVESTSDTDLRRKLQNKVTTLKEVTKQRDKLQANIHKIETKVKKYENLNSELIIFKEKAQVLDRVIEEKLGLERRLTRLVQLESEIDELRVRADKADELQRALENAQKKLLQLQENQSAARSEPGMCAIMDELRYKAREAEMMRIERDKMRMRLQEMLHIEHEYKLLQSRCRMLETIKNERDIYKTKNIELVYLQDEYASLRAQAEEVQVLTEERDALTKKVRDLEHIIHDQENEINRLVRHIERLSKGAEHQQDKIKDVISNLRSEIENKNLIISTSETQLADVQNQLKQTIASLTKETNALKQQVFEADATCVVLKARLERSSSQFTEATVALEKEKKNCSLYKAEVISLNQDNQRLQEIADRMNDLTDTGKIESILKHSHNALQNAALKLNQWSATPAGTDLVDSSTNTRPQAIKHAHKSIHTVTEERKVASIITDIMNIPTRDYNTKDEANTYQKRLHNLGLISTGLSSNNSEELSSTKLTSDKEISIKSSDNKYLLGHDGGSENVQTTPPSLSKMLDKEICITTSLHRPDTQDRGTNVDSTIYSSRGVQPTISGQTLSKSGVSATTITSNLLGPLFTPVDTATVCVDHTGVQVHKISKTKTKGQMTFREFAIVSRASQIEEDDIKGAYSKDSDDKTISPTKQLIPACKRPDSGKSCKNPSCACKSVQTRGSYSAEDAASEASSFLQSSQAAPCRKEIEPDDICVDSSEELIRLQELENQGKLSLTNITCACKHKQSQICKCPETSSQTEEKQETYAKDDDGKTISPATPLIPACKRPGSGKSCKNPSCPCKSVQTERSYLAEDSASDASPPSQSSQAAPCRKSIEPDDICVDSSEELIRLQELENEGKLSLTNITCVCKHKQLQVCECLETSSLTEKKHPMRIEQSENEDGRIPATRPRSVSILSLPRSSLGYKETSPRKASDDTICVDTEEDRVRLLELEDQRASSLINIRCICRGIQTKVCECRDKKRKDSRKVLTRKSSSDASNTICVDNEEDQKHLQELEEQRVLFWENVTCACKGHQTTICECKKSAKQSTASASIVATDKENAMQTVICECATSSTTPRRSNTSNAYVQCIPDCRNDVASDTICVDTEEGLLRIQQLHNAGQLSMENVQCACRGTQVEICECVESSTSTPVTEDQNFGQMKDTGEKYSDKIQCICKTTQSEIREGTCACKGIQHESGEGRVSSTPAPYYSGQPTNTTSGINSESISMDFLSMSKDIDPCEELRAEIKELKRLQDTMAMENQALRKHSTELKEVAKNQIAALSTELRKSREDWSRTDDSKTVIDLQEQNKVLQNQLASQNKLECECTVLKNQNELLLSQVEELNEKQCECSQLYSQIEELKKRQCECSRMYEEKLKQAMHGEGKSISETTTQTLQDEIKFQDDTIIGKSKFGDRMLSDSKEISSEIERNLDQLQSDYPDKLKPDRNVDRSDKKKHPSEFEIGSGAKYEEYEDGQIEKGKKQQLADKSNASISMISMSKTETQQQKDERKNESDDTTESKYESRGPTDGTGTIRSEVEKDQTAALAGKELEPKSISRHPVDDDDTLRKVGDTRPSVTQLVEKSVDKDKNKYPDDFLGKQLDNCMDELDDLRKQLAKCREELETQKKPEAVDLQKSNDDLRRQLEDLKKQLTAKEKYIDALPTKDLKTVDEDDLRKQLEALKKQLADAKNDLEQERSTPKVDAPDINDLLKQLEDLKKKLQDANKRLEDCEDHLAEEMKKLEDAKRELETAKKKLDAEKEQLADAKKTADLAKTISISSAIQAVVPTKEAHAQEPTKPTLYAAKYKAALAQPRETKVEKVHTGETVKTDDPTKETVGQAAEKGPARSALAPEVVTKAAAKEKTSATDLDGKQGRKTADVTNSQLSTTVEKSKSQDRDQMDEMFKENNAKLDIEKTKGADTQEPSTIADYKKRLAQSKQQIDDQKQLLKERASKLADIQNELMRTKEQSIESIRSARTSFERDITSMQDKYLEGIESMQAAHEDLISQGNAALEAEIDSLRKESIQKQTKIDELNCMCYEKKKKKINLCQVQVQAMDIEMECVCDDMLFAYLLRKVLYCGLESLTFEDLQYMHTKICDATAKVMGHVKKGERTLPSCCYDYKTRQTQAQTQVAKLQMEVALERQRLESLKKALDIERTTQAMMEHNFKIKAQCAQFPPSQPLPAYISHQNKSARTLRNPTVIDPFCPCKCTSNHDLSHRRMEASVHKHPSSTILHY